MGRWTVLFAGLLICAAAGCVSDEPMKRSNWLDRYRRFGYTERSNAVQLEVRIIEQPVSDNRYIDNEVWDKTDQWVINSEQQELDLKRKALIEKNGFRVGQIIGAVPERLHRLLTSKRNSINPVCLIREVGKPVPVQLGPVLADCRLQVRLHGRSKQMELHQSQFHMVIDTTPMNGKTKLRFVPTIEHGHSTPNFQPAEDRSGWKLEFQRSKKAFEELAWEVTLGNDDLLIIGTSLNERDSLGYQSLVDRTQNPPVQRLLVLRIRRLGTAGIDAEIPDAPSKTAFGIANASPLALRDCKKTVRSCGQ